MRDAHLHYTRREKRLARQQAPRPPPRSTSANLRVGRSRNRCRPPPPSLSSPPAPLLEQPRPSRAQSRAPALLVATVPILPCNIALRGPAAPPPPPRLSPSPPLGRAQARACNPHNSPPLPSSSPPPGPAQARAPARPQATPPSPPPATTPRPPPPPQTPPPPSSKAALAAASHTHTHTCGRLPPALVRAAASAAAAATTTTAVGAALATASATTFVLAPTAFACAAATTAPNKLKKHSNTTKQAHRPTTWGWNGACHRVGRAPHPWAEGAKPRAGRRRRVRGAHNRCRCSAGQSDAGRHSPMGRHRGDRRSRGARGRGPTWYPVRPSPRLGWPSARAQRPPSSRKRWCERASHSPANARGRRTIVCCGSRDRVPGPHSSWNRRHSLARCGQPDP
jgi:hypothetical protein